MSLRANVSCSGFPTDSSTSTNSLFPGDCNKEVPEKPPPRPLSPSSCMRFEPSSTSTTSSSLTTGVFNSQCRLYKPERKGPPNIGYETAIAKSILKQYSTLSGDNLFDHLSDIIKRVIDERPPNVIDFFEEFSRNVREQKFHMPERFPPDSVYEETRMYRVAKRVLFSMKLPYPPDNQEFAMDELEVEDTKSVLADDLKLEMDMDIMRRFKTFNERVQQLQFYWNQCGFSISSDDIFQLACSMNRLQTHPSIMQCRFWGVLNGLKASYYVVEASLTREELNSRLAQMEEELIAKQRKLFEQKMSKEPKPMPPFAGPELIPGMQGWENHPAEELAKMVPPADPIPLVEEIDVFDVPPEPIGSGLNRFSYFVVNSLSDNWIELPIVTPKQIMMSRWIKKFLTGDLEADIVSYPCFPGKEKHYLRAMIARITAGTYVAPRGYYRKMTKLERKIYDGLDIDEMDEEEGEEEEDFMDEDEEIDNDVILLKDKTFKPMELNMMAALEGWLHVRPNILNQGRVTWFDVEKAQKDRDKELARLLRLQMNEEEEELDEEDEGEEEEDGEEEEMLDTLTEREVGPPILTSIDLDTSDEFTLPWVVRYTSKYTNANERVLVLHSNVWPGAYTFIFENLCESIYMGWGHKYNSRNMPFKHLPQIAIEYPHTSEDFMEATDPSVEEEEAYRLALLARQKRPKQDDDLDEMLDEYDDEYESGSEKN